MTCPHCRASLPRRERVGRRCARCGKGFALDPQDTPFRLSDVRLREVARRLSHDGLLRFTGEQLYHAVQRPTPAFTALPVAQPRPKESIGTHVGDAVMALIFTAVEVALLRFAAPWINDAGFWGAKAVAVVSALLLWLAIWITGLATAISIGDAFSALRARRRPVAVPVHHPVRQPLTGLDAFRRGVLDRWTQVHGDLPGLCDDPPRPQWAVPPVLALVCPSASVRACLWANGVPVEMVDHPDDAPEGTPAAQLHDIAATAYVLAHARELPDLTPAIGAARDATWLRWHRLRTPPEPVRAALRAVTGLAPRERDLLDIGWYCPVEALPPAVLIGAVERHRRAVAARDPDHRAAHDLGFLDSPGDSVEA
jgi:hypothetical protein